MYVCMYVCEPHHVMIIHDMQYCVLDWPEQAPPSPTVDVADCMYVSNNIEFLLSPE